MGLHQTEIHFQRSLSLSAAERPRLLLDSLAERPRSALSYRSGLSKV